MRSSRPSFRALSVLALQRVIKPAAKRAGLGNVINHELRHTANTLWRQEGVTDGTYGHVTAEDMAQLRRAMERVSAATSPALQLVSEG
jgi:integrase